MSPALPDTDNLTQRLGAALTARKHTLATAESCTGGLIAAALTAVAGSSAWFGYGIVGYANAAKQQLLGVSPETLAQHGAVSAETVAQMAVGVRHLAQADWSIAVSGIAGPGGGSVAKPVGGVWFALAHAEGVETFWRHFSGDRQAVRTQAVEAALWALLQRVEVPKGC